MALIDRFARLFRADMHAVLDRLEEPTALLRQALRDMEDELARSTLRLKTLQIERNQIELQVGRTEAALAELGPELDLCFDAGNENLTRSLLRRRLEHERLLARLQQQRERLDADIADASAAVAEQRRKLDATRQKAAIFDPEPEHAAERGIGADDLTVTDADVDLAYLREKQKRRAL